MRANATFWQIGSGTGDRFYDQECFAYGMAFVGERYSREMQKVEEGDVVVLKRGTSHIIAVGDVVRHNGEVKGLADEGNKSWLKDFDGWDLPAYCYVEWRKPEEERPAQKRFAQTAICRIKDPSLQEQAKRILESNHPHPSNRDGPPPTQSISDEAIEGYLRRSIGAKDARRAVSTFSDLRALADWYYEATFRYWNEFKEHEIRAFLILPLLLALGWKRTQIKIEVSPRQLGARGAESIDIACFAKDYVPGGGSENGDNCKLIIESKRFDSGIARDAPDQARGYARWLENCDAVVVSNGYCYKAFERDSTDRIEHEPAAYLNIRNPKDAYPLDPKNVGGTLQVLRLLSPRF